jgi:phosphocarrier protein
VRGLDRQRRAPVEIDTDGEREQEAMDALLALINDKFGEGE